MEITDPLHGKVKLIFLFIFFATAALSQKVNTELFWKQWNNNSLHDTVRLNALYDHAWSYKDSNPDSTKRLAETGLRAAEKTGNKKQIGKMALLLAIVGTRFGEYDKSLEYCKNSLFSLEDFKYTEYYVLALNTRGNVYYLKGDINNALSNYQAALTIAEELKDPALIALVLVCTGNLYLDLSDSIKSRSFYIQSLKYFRQLHDLQGMGMAETNIGNTYQYTDPLNLQYTLQGYHKFEKINDNVHFLIAITNLGAIYQAIHKPDSAVYYYEKGLALAEKMNDQGMIANLCVWYAETKLELKLYDEGISYAERGIKIANEIGALVELAKGHEMLYEIYKKTGDYDKSLFHHEKYMLFSDSINGSAQTTLLSKKEFEFESKKREGQQKLIAQEQINKQKIIRNSFIGGSILLIILIFVLINRAKLKRTVEMERMRSRLSRDLHDDIGSTLSSINILSRTAQNNLQQTQDEKTKASLEKINERSQRLLDNISDIIWNINSGNDTIEEVMSRMREYATTILEAKNIDYTFDFPKEKMDCRLSMEVKNNIYLIFKEAVNNLSKYSGCSQTNLSLIFDEKNIHLKIEDNGCGFNKEEVKHRGGLINMQHRAEEIKGIFSISSVIGKGTSLELILPRYYN